MRISDRASLVSHWSTVFSGIAQQLKVLAACNEKFWLCRTQSRLYISKRIDNQVYRAILELPTYTASSPLRSEIGASSSKARDIKNLIAL